MLTLKITALYASLLVFLLIALSAYVIHLRLTFKVGLGHGEQPKLLQATRAHGNFVEYTPFMLLLLAIFELNGGSAMWLHIIGLVILLGRVSHAIALLKSSGPSIYRLVGMNATFIPLVTLAILNLLALADVSILGSLT